ncbi:MaoC/PaaZ C-terminal domain-containing protein [Microbacteriaceae bacterium 4G12]
MRMLEDLQKPAITHTQLVKYAGASGDFNPIHTVVPVAKEAGLPDVIAHGMLVMGFAGEALGKWFPRRALRKWSVRFAKMTVPGEVLTVTGQITGEVEKNGEVLLVGKVVVKNEQEEVKLKGQFEVVNVEELL